MSTYTQLSYHIVFGTKYRKKVLISSARPVLFKYIRGILANKKCHLYHINGITDHIHILTHIHPTISLSSLIKDIKVASTVMIKKEELLPGFTGWAKGYAAFTYSYYNADRLVNYVKNQEVHHKEMSYKQEYQKLLERHMVSFDEKYLV